MSRQKTLFRSVNHVRMLREAQKFDQALTECEKALKQDQGNPYLWNLRGDLIQLLDHVDGPPLSEAANSYKTALRINPKDVSALESLAHFYDAVEAKPRLARRYAKAWIRQTKQTLTDMEKIVVGDEQMEVKGSHKTKRGRKGGQG